MTTTNLPHIPMNDAELISASRNGNRDAFGQIVRKYQGMISGLVYAACGDLHRSEDIAQETFISAWKSLSGLRDAAKLPGWLCQIARRRIADHFRESATQKVQLQEQIAETIPAQVAEEKMSTEESELLWRTLSHIPQPYRETMVLYYRQGQSTAEVAAAMETTDSGVRQRLARGREMLREEMAAVVERSLVHSAPGPEFSLAVMASLPMAAVPTAAVTTTTAKGSAAAKGGGILLTISSWLGPVLGLLSMGLITFESIRQNRAGPAKKFIVGYWLLFWALLVVWIVGCIKLSTLGYTRHWDFDQYIYVFSLVGCVFSMLLFGLLAWSSSRQIANPQTNHPFKMFGGFGLRFLFLAPLIYCGLAWLINFAIAAHDHLTAELVAAAAIAGCAVCAWRGSNEAIRHNPLKMAFEGWLLMVSVTLLVLNLRLRSWVAVEHHLDLAEVQQRVPLWSINLAGAVLLAWMIFLSMRQKKLIENVSEAQ